MSDRSASQNSERLKKYRLLTPRRLVHDSHSGLRTRTQAWAGLLLLEGTALACGGRSRVEFEDAFANSGTASAGSPAGEGDPASGESGAEPSAGGRAHGGSGRSGDTAFGGTGGSGELNPAGAGNPGTGSACGDGICDILEHSDSCATDCRGSCDAPADLTSWVNVAPFISSGYATSNKTWLSCDPVDGPELAFRVEFPVAGILRASTESTATKFDTVLSIRSGNCNGREISCDDNFYIDTGSHSSFVSAWLDSHEPGIILLEAADGAVGQFALSLEFLPDDYDFDFAGSASGTLDGCDAELADVWGIALVKDERARVTVDTLDAESSADLAVRITNQTLGTSVPIDNVYQCTYPAPAGKCPSFTFTTASTGTYTFTVSLGTESCGTEPPKYRMDVQRQDAEVTLELFEDG